MGWRELLAWAKAMKRQTSDEGVSPDSWKGADQDGWWQEQRAKRDEERRR